MSLKHDDFPSSVAFDLIAAALKDENEKKVPEDQRKSKRGGPSWEEVCGAAAGTGNLSAQGHWGGPGHKEDTRFYHLLGVACSEVEVDVITGDTEVLSVDLHYDSGKSLNPAVDITQAEGGFVIGLGHILREKIDTDLKTGRLISNGTWTYKPPLARDVPIRFNVSLLENSVNEDGILGSKAVGEPTVVLAVSVAMAVRQAVQSARKDAGLDPFVQLDLPLTPDVIATACGGSHDQYKL